MKRNRKSINELNLIDDFLFTEASTDAQTSQILVRLIIERATQLKVKNLIIEPQKTINGIDPNHHGIRIDVAVREAVTEDGKTVQLFDIEPNTIKKVHLPKRSRFYQALTDVKLLETGIDYEQLPDMWSIWILPYDPFGMNQMVYTVKNVVEENPNIVYNDGVKKLFLYTKGKEGGSQALKNLLTYLENSNAQNAVDEDLKTLHTNVERIKHSAGIGGRYMALWEFIKYTSEEIAEELAVEIAEERAVKLAEERAVKLAEERTEDTIDKVTTITRHLLDEGRYDDLRRFTEDAAYRKELLEAYK